MILADTSVWIDLLRRRLVTPVPADVLAELVTCGPVVQEVLQGLRDSPDAQRFRAAFDAIPRIGDPLPEAIFREAADIFSFGRRRGLTIRSSTDCLIAAIAIDNSVPVWHSDRDFRAIASYTRLRVLDRIYPGSAN